MWLPSRSRCLKGTLAEWSTAHKGRISDNTFSRIMELIEGSSYYRNDLTEQDVLELIPRGLGLVEVEEGGHWLLLQILRPQRQ